MGSVRRNQGEKMSSGDVARSRHQEKLRVVAYLGMDRPSRKTDYGESLVKKIIHSRHILAGLILHPSDPLADLARKYSIPYISVPFELLQPSLRIKQALAENTRFVEFYRLWLEHIRSFNADIGVSVWSCWVPDELFTMPRHGFVNYHPAPLPKMRGMEPDTFAILEGLTEIYGTVHSVNRSFDCGDILAWTGHIPIHRYDTPVSVLENLNREGVSTIINVLDSFADGSVKPIPQCHEEGTVTTREMARKASMIDWSRDTVDVLDRKHRAFCGQDIGIRLKGLFNGEIRDVVELEALHGDFPGKPGDLLGQYKGRGAFEGYPVIRLSDGAAVVHFGRTIVPLPYSSIFYNECPQEKLLTPGFHRRHVSLPVLCRSIGLSTGSVTEGKLSPFRGLFLPDPFSPR